MGFETDFDLLDFEFEKARMFFTPGSEYGLDENRKWFRVTVSKAKDKFLTHLETIYLLNSYLLAMFR